jgi:hypothetical protein
VIGEIWFSVFNYFPITGRKIGKPTMTVSGTKQFCRKYHFRKPAFFGSVVRQDFSPKSDIDDLSL